MDLLPYVVDLMLEVADLNLILPDLRSTEIRLTLTPVRRLRGAWFSRLLRHLARRRSGSILSLGTHTGHG